MNETQGAVLEYATPMVGRGRRDGSMIALVCGICATAANSTTTVLWYWWVLPLYRSGTDYALYCQWKALLMTVSWLSLGMAGVGAIWGIYGWRRTGSRRLLLLGLVLNACGIVLAFV